MIESYIAARDRFLRPGGNMFPTQSNIYFAPFCDEVLYAEQYQKSLFFAQVRMKALESRPPQSDSKALVPNCVGPFGLLPCVTKWQSDFHGVDLTALRSRAARNYFGQVRQAAKHPD